MLIHNLSHADNPAQHQHDPKDVRYLLRELRFHRNELAKCKRESREFRRKMEKMRGSFAEFFDLLPVGYLTLDEMGHTLEINRTGAATLGGIPEDLLGKQFIAWIAEEDRTLFLSRLRQAFLSRDNPVIDIKIETTRGTVHDVRLGCIVMESVDTDKVLSCHILMADLSEHSKVEAASSLTSSVLEGRDHDHRFAKNHPLD